jgi:site-specific DNA-methyltransferase (adenine-specific)
MPRKKSASKISWNLFEEDCLKFFQKGQLKKVQLTYFDPPYLQGKDYQYFDDDQSEETYWTWIREVLSNVYEFTRDGGAIYFMHREKQAANVLRSLKQTGWIFQNLIIWVKRTSAVPGKYRFSKQYQIIAFATKGERPRVFNKLRIDLPLRPEYKQPRKNGVFLTDVWDDIREMTSGYLAGNEAIRDSEGNRAHKQQSPVALLLRIILSSTMPGDIVLDPCAGTGTTLVVAQQLKRDSIGIEIDPAYVTICQSRLESLRPSDNIQKHVEYYRFTEALSKIWGGSIPKQGTLI